MATGRSGYVEWNGLSSIYSVNYVVRANWSETYNETTNSSVVTIDSIQVKTSVSAQANKTFYPDLTVKLNGVAVLTMDAIMGTHIVTPFNTNTWYDIVDANNVTATASGTVIHDADGSKSTTIELVANNKSNATFLRQSSSWDYNGWYVTGSKSIDLTTITTYTLSISAGTGSTVTVNRTSSGYGATGVLQNGYRLYAGDSLKISAAAEPNYQVKSLTVNGAAFTSGNTHTVSGNVSVVSTAQALASAITATDANIGGSSSVTVNRYNTSYYHSIRVNFGTIGGYLTSTGSISQTEVKYQTSSITFAIPVSFYTEVTNAKTKQCTLTCRTYSSSTSTTVLGAPTTCTFTVSTVEADCSPIVTGTVVDTNSDTATLTGGSSLIRFKSTAECTISASPRYSATITSKSVNGITPDSSNKVVISGDNLASGAFTFSATDSRGYTATALVSKQIVNYIKLTLNPVFSRPSPSTGEMSLTFGGNFYRGSFGAYSNTLTIQYQYKKSSETTYSNWITISSSSYSIGTSTYATESPIALVDSGGSTTGFDYREAYDFRIRAYDGNTTAGVTLTSVIKTTTVERGIPIFDIGQNDMNFNVDVDFKEDVNFDGQVSVNNVPIADYITESHIATSTGDWSWKKYASGDVVLYGRFSVRPASWSDAGGKYYYSSATLIEMPFEVTNAAVSGTSNAVALVTNCSVDEDGLWLRLIRWSNEVTDFTVQVVVYGELV